jgi:hypothetical protein
MPLKVFQVCDREMSESELADDPSKTELLSKPGSEVAPWDKLGSYLFTDQATAGAKAA